MMEITKCENELKNIFIDLINTKTSACQRFIHWNIIED